MQAGTLIFIPLVTNFNDYILGM